MLAAVRSAVLEGVDGRVVTVEVHVSRGLPGYTVVGLPDAAGPRVARAGAGRVAVVGARVPAAAGHREPRARVGAQDRRRASSSRSRSRLLCAADGLPAGALDGVGVLGELGLDGARAPGRRHARARRRAACARASST